MENTHTSDTKTIRMIRLVILCKSKSNRIYLSFVSRRVWRYQRGWSESVNRRRTDSKMAKTKVQKEKQRSTKHTHKTKDRVTRTPLKTGDELRFCRRVSNFRSTSGTRRVNLVTKPVISHEWGKDREVLATSGTYQWLYVTHLFHSG